ncbi:MAG: hypothetical protein ACRDRU_28080 [Pseudonocardiaceae bacterium]
MADEVPAISRGTTEARPWVRVMETLAAVVVGAVIAGFSNWVVAGRQATATHEETLRTQRVTAYSQFLADSDELDRTHAEFVRIVATAPSHYSNDAIATVKKPVDDVFRKVNQDVSVVVLAGSPRAALLAEEILNSDFARHNFVDGIELFVNINASDDQYNKMMKGLADTLVDKNHQDLLEKFTEQAILDVNKPCSQ